MIPNNLSDDNEWCEEYQDMFTKRAGIRTWYITCGELGKVNLMHFEKHNNWGVDIRGSGAYLVPPGINYFTSSLDAVAYIKNKAGHAAVQLLMDAGIEVPEELDQYI